MGTKMVRLTDEQRKIVEAPDGPMLIKAPPGSGKTRVVSERIRFLVARTPTQHFRILALTFTKAAAATLRDRLVDLPATMADRVEVTNFHAFCHSVLNDQGISLGVVSSAEVRGELDDRVELLRSALVDDGLIHAGSSADPKSERQALVAALAMISSKKREFGEVDEVDRAQKIPDTPWRLHVAWGAYERALQRANVIDFDDLLARTYRLLADFPEVAALLRRLYKYIFIDEAQDLSDSQYRVLRVLCNNEHRNIMMVADENQAINAFAGASTKWLDQFLTDFGATPLALTINFRSGKKIQRLAARLRVLADATDPADSEENWAAEGQVEGGVLATDSKEAQAIADKIVNLLAHGLSANSVAAGESLSVEPEDIVVLGRASWVLGAIRDELRSRQIQTAELTAPQDRWGRDGRWLLEWLRWLANPDDHLAARRVAAGLSSQPEGPQTAPDTPLQVLSWLPYTDGPFCVAAAALTDLVAVPTQDPGKWLDSLICCVSDDSTLATSGEDVERRQRLVADLRELKRGWLSVRDRLSGGSTAGSLVRSTHAGVAEAKLGAGVRLLTVHAAKGMEFRAVFICGLCEGVFPDYRAKTPEALDDEKRSLYVAVSRASRYLWLSCPKQSGGWDRQRSQFIRLILPVLNEAVSK